MSDCLVQISGLIKSYGGAPVLQGLDLSLSAGKIIGLLGPNASGKTTLIKILAGLLTPSCGEVRIAGFAPGPETKAMVSYLPERPYFNSWMRVSECLDFFTEFYTDFDRTLAEGMLADLSVPTDAKLRTLSKGTKEKVQLVLVMARRARLYLLDEPIAGVDPAAREYILRTIISAYHKEATVLLSTHLIADVQDILDEFLLIRDGQILIHSDVATLQAEKGMTPDAYFREVFRCSRSF